MLVVSDSFYETIELYQEKSKVLKFLVFALSQTYFNNKMLDSKNFNFLSIRTEEDEVSISYIAENRIKECNDEWKQDKRQLGKIGRTLRNVIKREYLSQFSDQDFEIATNLLKSNNSGGDFEIVKGQDIRETYLKLPLFYDGGSLGSSCMRYSSCENYFEIYESNPDVCQMVRLMHPSGKLMGRALLWITRCGTKVMDRIYTCKDAFIDSFKTWAKENGYDYKYRQSYEDKEEWINHKTNEQYDKIYHIDLETDCEEFPYIDTFTYGGKGFITNDSDDLRITYKNDNTGGQPDYYDLDVCAITNEEFRKYHLVKIAVGEYKNKKVLKEFAFESAVGWVWKDDPSLVKDYEGNLIYLDETYQNINGKYYSINVLNWSQEAEKWFLEGDEAFEWSEQDRDWLIKK